MQIPEFLVGAPLWAVHLGIVILAAFVALIAHKLVFRLLAAIARRSHRVGDDKLVARLHNPVRWTILAIAIGVARRSFTLGPDAIAVWRSIEGFVVPALLGWILIALLGAMQDSVIASSDIAVEDNLEARRRRTRMGLIARIGTFLIVFVTMCLMLLSIPSVRSVGVSLLASAGIAGLVLGAAAQPVLKNVIAGIQMAFTEPIRIDDAIVIENEWGWVEEIRLTYVVVKLWDERRLIVPVSRFLEAPFQNWTRESAGLLGAIFLQLDPAADIDRLRSEFEKVVKAEPLWDGRGQVLQVTESRAEAIEVRMLATARNSPQAFDLRCAIREKMLSFVRREMPEALPRGRQLLGRDGTREAARDHAVG